MCNFPPACQRASLVSFLLFAFVSFCLLHSLQRNSKSLIVVLLLLFLFVLVSHDCKQNCEKGLKIVIAKQRYDTIGIAANHRGMVLYNAVMDVHTQIIYVRIILYCLPLAIPTNPHRWQ